MVALCIPAEAKCIRLIPQNQRHVLYNVGTLHIGEKIKRSSPMHNWEEPTALELCWFRDRSAAEREDLISSSHPHGAFYNRPEKRRFNNVQCRAARGQFITRFSVECVAEQAEFTLTPLCICIDLAFSSLAFGFCFCITTIFTAMYAHLPKHAVNHTHF